MCLGYFCISRERCVKHVTLGGRFMDDYYLHPSSKSIQQSKVHLQFPTPLIRSAIYGLYDRQLRSPFES
jgi:hypothetical protein